MKLSFLVGFIAFGISWRFFEKGPIQERDNKQIAINLLELRYLGATCPKNYTVYSLTNGDAVWRFQTETDSCGRNHLRKCHVSLKGSSQNAERVDPSDNGHEEMISRHENVMNEACSMVDYSTDPDRTTVLYDNHDLSPETIAKMSAKSNSSAASYLSRGIFPGTKWCGFGNIADDVYDRLGEHVDTDACCRAHDNCRPILHPFSTRYHLRNPSIFPMLHCACDVETLQLFSSCRYAGIQRGW